MTNPARDLARVSALAVLLAGTIALAGVGSSAASHTTSSATNRPVGNPSCSGAHARFGVGEIVVRFIDTSRFVQLPGKRPQPRPLVTVIRYPAIGDPSHVEGPGAPPAKSSGPFPLVVFGHGFNVTPAIYARLLQAWASAGYVVAAPIFPLTNKNAPGGANESDIVSQPADMRVVITRMLAASAARRGILSRLLDPHEIAVSGQSDGGMTALATATTRITWTGGSAPRSSSQARSYRAPPPTFLTGAHRCWRLRGRPTPSTCPRTPTTSFTRRTHLSSC